MPSVANDNLAMQARREGGGWDGTILLFDVKIFGIWHGWFVGWCPLLPMIIWQCRQGEEADGRDEAENAGGNFLSNFGNYDVKVAQQ